MDVFSAPLGELPQAASSPDEIARFVAEAATRAPSAYDTAPWWFSTSGPDVWVRSDLERKLPVIDPAGRQLTISCGAAVFTARIAMRYLGLVPDVMTLPDQDTPNLIAKIGWDEQHKPPGEFERKLFGEIPVRSTHHGDFASRRLPPGLMSTLSEEALRENVTLRVISDDARRDALLAMLDVADHAFGLDGARSAEAGADGGVSSHGWGVQPAQSKAVPGAPGIVAVLTTPDDEPADWVSAGQSLQRVLLVAGSHDVAVALHSQPLEFGQLRDFIRTELLGSGHPQMVLRFGTA